MLVNSASYGLNLSAMEAALAAGCHYLDLGGLYHLTRRQLELHDRFRAAGLLAVLGIGASPGKTNVMARLAADRLDEVHELHVSAAASDPTPPEGGLAAPYAIETILDELTLPAVVVRGGEVHEVPALTPGGDERFPEPIGDRRTVYTLHSELATFPTSFPGLREASFRLSLAPALAYSRRGPGGAGPGRHGEDRDQRCHRLAACRPARHHAAQGRHSPTFALNCGGARGRCKRDEER